MDPSLGVNWSSSGEAEFRLHLCVGPNCSARGSQALLPVLEKAIETAGLTGKVEITASTCRNRCEIGPSLNIYPGPFFYREVTAAAIERIVTEHLVAGVPVDDHLVKIALPNLPDIF